MDLFTALFLIALLIPLGIGVANMISVSENKKKLEIETSSIRDFSRTFYFIGSDGKSAIAIDQSQKNICLTDLQHDIVSNRIFSYRDLLSVEILQDGSSVTKTSRTSQAGGALVGGLIFGGVGAVVGALSGTKTTRGKVSRVDLQIVINDPQSPVFTVNFQNTEVAQNSSVHKAALSNAREWMGRINIWIRLADKEDQPKVFELVSAGGVADELRKLADLKEGGVITGDEFELQKQKILSGNQPLLGTNH